MRASIRTLLESIVDYAGLFPPVACSMADAVRHYAGYRGGAESWMLGRFVLPAGRIEEFEQAAACHLPGDGEPWRLSVLVGPDVAATMDAIERFNGRHRFVVVDSLELKAATIDAIEEKRHGIPGSLDTYVEIPIDEDPALLLEAIGRTGFRAKVRTGATTPEGFPTPPALARFLARCASLNVPFKATAGLHHAVRSQQALTYEADSPRARMHGFLNVFLATALLAGGMGEAMAAEMLEESRPDALIFREDRAGWRDYSIGIEALSGARRSLALSFGSCSFQEPVDELRNLQLL